MSPTSIPPCRNPRWTPEDVFYIVRGAIQDGIIDGITLAEFDEELRFLTPAESEDYVQALWDRI